MCTRIEFNLVCLKLVWRFNICCIAYKFVGPYLPHVNGSICLELIKQHKLYNRHSSNDKKFLSLISFLIGYVYMY